MATETGGLLSVTTKDATELTPADCQRLFDGLDHHAAGDMKELCCVSASPKELDSQTNGCNDQESPENCYTDSGISNSADMDTCYMEILDDLEANGEDCTADEDSQMTFGSIRQETINATASEGTNINNVPGRLFFESETNGDGTAETALNHNESGSGKCSIYDGSCNTDTYAECSLDIEKCDTNSDDVLSACATVDSVHSSQQHSVKDIADDASSLDVEVDDSTAFCPGVGSEEALDGRRDEHAKSSPDSTEHVTSTDVEHFALDKPVNEGAVVGGASADMATVVTSAAGFQSQFRSTFTSSRSVPRPPLRQTRPRMGSYGSPPPSATPSTSCPPDDELSKQQYVVNVHVNPGETFSVCVSDQVQLIQGNICEYLHIAFKLTGRIIFVPLIYYMKPV